MPAIRDVQYRQRRHKDRERRDDRCWKLRQRGSTTGTDGTKTTTAGGTDGTEATGGGKIETVSGDGSQGSSTQTTGDGTGGTETIGTNNTGGGEDTGPDNGTQETTTGLTKMVDVGVAWLRHYDGGPCFFIAVTSVTDKTLMAKGFGLDAPAFQKLYNSFRSTNDFDQSSTAIRSGSHNAPPSIS